MLRFYVGSCENDAKIKMIWKECIFVYIFLILDEYIILQEFRIYSYD